MKGKKTNSFEVSDAPYQKNGQGYNKNNKREANYYCDHKANKEMCFKLHGYPQG